MLSLFVPTGQFSSRLRNAKHLSIHVFIHGSGVFWPLSGKPMTQITSNLVQTLLGIWNSLAQFGLVGHKWWKLLFSDQHLKNFDIKPYAQHYWEGFQKLCDLGPCPSHFSSLVVSKWLKVVGIDGFQSLKNLHLLCIKTFVQPLELVVSKFCHFPLSDLSMDPKVHLSTNALFTITKTIFMLWKLCLYL